MPGNHPTVPPTDPTRPRQKAALTRDWESAGNGIGDHPDPMGTRREPAGNAPRANRRMHLSLLASLSGGHSSPLPDDEWAAAVEAALTDDPDAVRRLFAAAARWANRLICQRSWILDPEAEIVSLMWGTLHARPSSSDEWRHLVLVRLRRREYRPSPELATTNEVLDTVCPSHEFEPGTLDRFTARAALQQLAPTPPAMGPYLAAVWTDQRPTPASAHVARQYRYQHRRKGVA